MKRRAFMTGAGAALASFRSCAHGHYGHHPYPVRDARDAVRPDPRSPSKSWDDMLRELDPEGFPPGWECGAEIDQSLIDRGGFWRDYTTQGSRNCTLGEPRRRRNWRW